MDVCLTKQPPLYQIDTGGHYAACYLYADKPQFSPVELQSEKVK
jgi:hypothetical protein